MLKNWVFNDPWHGAKKIYGFVLFFTDVKTNIYFFFKNQNQGGPLRYWWDTLYYFILMFWKKKFRQNRLSEARINYINGQNHENFSTFSVGDC